MNEEQQLAKDLVTFTHRGGSIPVRTTMRVSAGVLRLAERVAELEERDAKWSALSEELGGQLIALERENAVLLAGVGAIAGHTDGEDERPTNDDWARWDAAVELYRKGGR
jgi:hypothetical protein